MKAALRSRWTCNLTGGGDVQVAGTKAGAQPNPLTIDMEENGKEINETPECLSVNSFNEEIGRFVGYILIG